MDTAKRPDPSPLPFSPDEIAAASQAPGDQELDGIEPAAIEERGSDDDGPFEKWVQKSRKLSPERVAAILESLFFVADRPLTERQLHEATGIDPDQIRRSIESLCERLREGPSGLWLTEVAGGWQLRTDPGAAEYVRRFLKVKPQRLTRAAVETLAIIAYRQPVTRPEVEDIRGVESGAVIKALLERRLIKILGKKEEVGRPLIYGTTKEFLEFFALKDLSSLPTLREFQELSAEHQAIVEKEVPAEPVPLTELADSGFSQRAAEGAQSSRAALEELEQAIERAEISAKASFAALQPPQKPDEG